MAKDARGSILIAVVLLAIACAILFGFHPGGFESQTGWAVLLLPGMVPVYFVLHGHAIPQAIYTTLFLIVSLSWYWTLSFVVLRVSHFLFRRSGV